MDKEIPLMKCTKCGEKALWCYMPFNTETKDVERYFCDNCVSRGCSCNIDPDTKIEDTDEQGRFLPCCEYDYDKDGWHKSFDDGNLIGFPI